jgi:acetamidase/formamidase
MTKTITKKDNIKYALSANDDFVGAVEPGEIFDVECAINCNDGVVTHLGQQLTLDDVELPYVNGATGPIEVRGAKPGDMLTVEVLDMRVNGLGYSSLWPGIGIFPDWVRHEEFGIKTHVVEVTNGVVHWNDKLKLPVRPMIGVAGVAPKHGAVLTVDNGTHGGNMDVQEITTGTKVMFKVEHEGAHLFLGDCHAIQGDGECVGMGAVEIAADLTIRVSLSKAPARLTWPRVETPTHYGAIGCARPLEDAMRISFEELIDWMADDWGIPEPDGYLLLAQVAEARCTQMVNPKYSYICTISKEILAAYR